MPPTHLQLSIAPVDTVPARSAILLAQNFASVEGKCVPIHPPYLQRMMRMRMKTKRLLKKEHKGLLEEYGNGFCHLHTVKLKHIMDFTKNLFLQTASFFEKRKLQFLAA